MAVIIIQAVPTKTVGGFDAIITGIDPTNGDCLIGTIDTPRSGIKDFEWNLGGICRDTDESCNLDMRKNETHNLRVTAEKLGVK